jgi:hypothetical protein
MTMIGSMIVKRNPRAPRSALQCLHAGGRGGGGAEGRMGWVVWPFFACIRRHVGDVRLRLPDRLVTEVVVPPDTHVFWRAEGMGFARDRHGTEPATTLGSEIGTSLAV